MAGTLSFAIAIVCILNCHLKFSSVQNPNERRFHCDRVENMMMQERFTHTKRTTFTLHNQDLLSTVIRDGWHVAQTISLITQTVQTLGDCLSTGALTLQGRQLWKKLLEQTRPFLLQ